AARVRRGAARGLERCTRAQGRPLAAADARRLARRRGECIRAGRAAAARFYQGDRATVTGLGFAGLGWLGEALIKDVCVVPGLRVAGVQDVRRDVAESIAERYASPWFGVSFDELLQVPDVEAVVICTPNALHVPQAQA